MYGFLGTRCDTIPGTIKNKFFLDNHINLLELIWFENKTNIKILPTKMVNQRNKQNKSAKAKKCS